MCNIIEKANNGLLKRTHNWHCSSPVKKNTHFSHSRKRNESLTLKNNADIASLYLKDEIQKLSEKSRNRLLT